jgi:hypothetical protein
MEVQLLFYHNGGIPVNTCVGAPKDIAATATATDPDTRRSEYFNISFILLLQVQI